MDDKDRMVHSAIELLNEALEQDKLLSPYRAMIGGTAKVGSISVGDTAVTILDRFVLDTKGVSLIGCTAVFINDGSQYTRILFSGEDERGEVVHAEITHDGGS